MNAPNTNPFAVDPYAHQPDGEWKTERLRGDQDMLCRLLGLSAQEVHDASATFAGREPDFFRFIMALRFLRHVLQNELKEEASTLKIVAAIFTVEGVAPPTLLPNRNRLKRFFVQYLAPEEKRALLTGFLFAEGHGLGQPGQPARHLMYQDFLGDVAFRQKYFLDSDPAYCSSWPHSLCVCGRWLGEQDEAVTNAYTEQLADKLYDMRNAVAHDAGPVFFASTEERPPDAAQWSMTLVDVFTREQRGSFVTYESGLHVRDVLGIFLNGLRRCFGDGARFLEFGAEDAC